MVDWAGYRRLVSEKLNENLEGADDWKPITYRRRGEETYHPPSGTITPGTDQDYALNALIYTFGFSQSMAGDRELEDEAPIAVDRKCLFAAVDLPIEPRIGDYVFIDGDTWRIIGVNKDPGTMHINLHIRPLIHS